MVKKTQDDESLKSIVTNLPACSGEDFNYSQINDRREKKFLCFRPALNETPFITFRMK